MRALLLFLLCFLPLVGQAAVSISEIAWMGTAVSANDEWIELYNSGESSVSLEGWVLKDGMSLEIPLSGSIGSKEYGVLERTDDESAQGSALLIYTGALANTGATLSLYRTDGSLEDQVSGGENWMSIGGDNVTKETPQYTTSGWVTALATPGQEVGEDVSNDEDNEEEEVVLVSKEKSTDSKGEGEIIELKVPNVSLSLTLSGPDIAYVHQPVSFSVLSHGLGKTIMDSLVYEWNFGDLNTSSRKDATHVFNDAGEYVVAVYASFARHKQLARKTVTVLPVAFSLSQNSDGDLRIHNNAKYEVDISGYRLKGDTQLILPPRSIMLPNATITIPKKILKNNSVGTILYDQKGTMVASTIKAAVPIFETAVKTSVASFIPQAQAEEEIETAQASSSNFLFVTEVADSGTNTALSMPKESEKEPFQTASIINARGGIPKNSLPYLGLLGVLGLGIIAILAGRRG